MGFVVVGSYKFKFDLNQICRINACGYNLQSIGGVWALL